MNGDSDLSGLDDYEFYAPLKKKQKKPCDGTLPNSFIPKSRGKDLWLTDYSQLKG